MRARIKKLPLIGTLVVSASALLNRAKGIATGFAFYQKNKHVLLKNKTLKNSNTGKACFVLACGPSINAQDLSGLADQCTISVSNFFVHKDFSKINPTFHFFAASHDPITDEQMVAWLRQAETHFRTGQKVLIADTDRYLVEQHAIFKNQEVYYYHTTQKDISPKREVDFTAGIPRNATIAHTAMYLAFYIGSKNIYLLGVDHDWILHIGESKHFYKESQSELVNKGYVETVAKKETNLENDFKNYLKLWGVYKKIKGYAQAHGVAIWNSTPHSLLDVFPRKALENVLQENNPTL